MTALALNLREGAVAVPASQRPRLAVARTAREPVAGTLDALLTGALTAVGTGSATRCPVCAGTMQPRWTANSGANGGRCADCGSILS